MKHIIEIEGGPHHGKLLDLASDFYKKTDPPPPGHPNPAFFGVPIYERDDGRRYVKWADIDSLWATSTPSDT